MFETDIQTCCVMVTSCQRSRDNGDILRMLIMVDVHLKDIAGFGPRAGSDGVAE